MYQEHKNLKHAVINFLVAFGGYVLDEKLKLPYAWVFAIPSAALGLLFLGIS